MDKLVFFADILGFGNLSKRQEASPALDALSDIARILSVENSVARFLNSYNWDKRFALSDSLFLVGTDREGVCEAASEFFFNLAFYNIGSESSVLVRGAIAEGNIQYAEPIFPETGKINIVGDAVVNAVSMEKYGPKGPRLFISRSIFDSFNENENTSCVSRIFEKVNEEFYEILWLLPPRPGPITDEMSYMIAELCVVILGLFERHCGNPKFGPHYVGYLDLALRSLIRLKSSDPEKTSTIVKKIELTQVLRNGKTCSSIPGVPELLEKAKTLLYSPA